MNLPEWPDYNEVIFCELLNDPVELLDDPVELLNDPVELLDDPVETLDMSDDIYRHPYVNGLTFDRCDNCERPRMHPFHRVRLTR